MSQFSDEQAGYLEETELEEPHLHDETELFPY